MITLSLNFDGLTGKTARASHEKKVREIVDTHLGFPGSEKLKMGVTIKNNGSSSVTFAGPSEIVSEAKRLWQEKVEPAATRLRAAVGTATESAKRKAAPTVRKATAAVNKSVAPKKKKARVVVKAKVVRKPAAKKKKK